MVVFGGEGGEVGPPVGGFRGGFGFSRLSRFLAFGGRMGLGCCVSYGFWLGRRFCCLVAFL